MTAEYFEIVPVGIVKRCQRVTVNIEHGTHHPILVHDGHHNLRARTATAGDMPRKQFHIGYHLRAGLGPCRPAHATSLTNAVAGNIALEGTECKMLATHQIETYPEPPESLAQTCRGIGQHAHLLMLIGNVRKEILYEMLVASRLIGCGICECRFHKSEE